MTSSVSSFFLRDTMLKRQGRTARARRVPELTRSSSTSCHPLNIILEEDESRISSRSPSPIPSASSSGSRSPGIKAKRRHANIAEIRIARDALMLADNDLSPLDDSLFAPRPAPRPPTESSSPEQSPDSFRLTFTDASFKFPHPPMPISGHVSSPTRSISSLSSSPCSQHGGMPLTPSTSDDESSDFLNPRPVPVLPLVITKHNPRPSSPHEISISPSLVQAFKEPVSEADPSCYASFLEDSSDESDAESDSEWYTRQFSKILTLRSPIPPSFPLQNPSRPESMSIPAEIIARRRVSKSLPPTPTLSYRDSLESFTGPASPSKRSSRIPKYPPPPVPPIPVHLRPESTSSFTSCSKTLPTTFRRPPPRSSIPADCDFELDVEDHADDASSEFSFSMYDIDLGEREGEMFQSPVSSYSQSSFDEEEGLSAQEITFDMDYPMMLPLSLPASPFDLEADFAMSLEKLRTEDVEVELPISAVTNPEQEISEQIPEVPQPAPQPQELVVDDIFSPVSSAFSFSPAPSVQFHSYPSPSASPALKHKVYNDDERVLKSKWSTSTLGSVREEHERRGASSKLRLYFGGQSPAKSKRTSSSAPKKVPPTPTSPFGALISPRKTSRGFTTSPSPPSASPSRNGHGRAHSRGNSDVMVIGYGGGGVGVRRRGSVATVSDAGSEESASSTSSSGLRRKPIPIEMFLRSDLPVFLKSATSA
ncbi:hypothetical protein M413DRAFT_287357 [Hebeloma cylindrosporum]|uniref:Uncharacterized protein n=1 Tax=Hebeloma cylindrosporum TaxID=76867 RepID=A0A0C3BJ27_HEBCY|nr:hypothetical protein M413DRAFT_287357 [Hebeloma cylindrosporum h7]